MKKNKIIQFSLVIVGIILFFFTYYSREKDEIVDIDKFMYMYAHQGTSGRSRHVLIYRVCAGYSIYIGLTLDSVLNYILSYT